MSLDQDLLTRANHQCELCSSKDELDGYSLPNSELNNAPSPNADTLLLCAVCRQGIESPSSIDSRQWRCLSDSIWSATPVVQVAAWRLLKACNELWAQDLLDTMYLDDETLAWASAPFRQASDDTVICKDANGTQLAAGDTVVVIKDLPVKGTSMVAKRGTAVRGISLTSNPEHIEGRVNGQRIVLLSCYVKKS